MSGTRQQTSIFARESIKKHDDISRKTRVACLQHLRKERSEIMGSLRTLQNNREAIRKSISTAVKRTVRNVREEIAGVISHSSLNNSYYDTREDDLLSDSLERDLMLMLEDYENTEVLDGESQNNADAELYECHLKNGIPCVMCSNGILSISLDGLLWCDTCHDMNLQLPEGSSIEKNVAPALHDASLSHTRSCCNRFPIFRILETSIENSTNRSLIAECLGGWNYSIF